VGGYHVGVAVVVMIVEIALLVWLCRVSVPFPLEMPSECTREVDFSEKYRAAPRLERQAAASTKTKRIKVGIHAVDRDIFGVGFSNEK
jgi:hypothetical protein